MRPPQRDCLDAERPSRRRRCADPAHGRAVRLPLRRGMMAQAGSATGRRPGARAGPPRLGVAGAARADRGGAEVRAAARRGRHLAAWSSASTWARWTWWSRSRPRRRVASGLQRIGRAGHQVGAVVTWRDVPQVPRRPGPVAPWWPSGCGPAPIEELRYPRNPLDVLAQQIVAMAALDEWTVDELEALRAPGRPVRRAARGALEAVLDMLAGRYPSEEFAELRPRLVWDRVTGTLTGPPGAQRLAVTTGGTIPDRGLFGVFLAGGEKSPAGGSASSTRRWSTSRGSGTCSCSARPPGGSRTSPTTGCWSPPPPGSRGKAAVLEGRHASAGRRSWAGPSARSLRECRRRGAAAKAGAADAAGERRAGRCAAATCSPTWPSSGGDRSRARRPDPVVERFRDELGDWRVVVHSPFGAAGARAVGAGDRRPAAGALRRRRAAHALRRRHRAAAARHARGRARRASDARRLRRRTSSSEMVTAEVGGSALFAARFRECAARALLLPRRDPGRRQPLWQQRQRAAQLLDVAGRYASFPIVAGGGAGVPAGRVRRARRWSG